MPENETQELQVSEMMPITETALERFERERMTRRQALKKLGITSAMATFALFSVDDLAHMVGKAMEQRARDNKVVEQIAKEFRNAGVAMATSISPSCNHCYAAFNVATNQATADFITCYNAAMAAGKTSSQATTACNNSPYCPEWNNAIYAYNGCCAAHCPPGYCVGQPRGQGC